MLEIVLLSIAGILVGFFAGILPGIHPNQIYVLLLALLPLIPLSQQSLIAFIISTAISNVIFNYIPSLFFSIPDSSTVLNVLPGHRMVLEGQGLKALFISISSALLTFICITILVPAALIILPIISGTLSPIIHILLIVLALWMVWLEKDGKKRLLSLLLFFMSGIWGIVTLNSPFVDSSLVLFPVLTGMFGVAGLIMSVKSIDKLPSQDKSEVNVKGYVKVLISGVGAGFLTGILPGAGESQAGVAVSQISGVSQEQFLGSLASINASNLVFALLALFSFGKIRSGLTAGINGIVDSFNYSWLLLSLGVILFSAGVSVIACWVFGKRMLSIIEGINYNLLSKLILLFTIVMVIWLTGIAGFFILIVSTCLGLLSLFWNVKRTSNMGYLMLPLILYFSGLSNVIVGLMF